MVGICCICYTHDHFTAFWNMSGTTRVSRYQKVHFAIFWIICSKMKITRADAPTIWMDFQTNWCPNLCHPHHFYAGCPSLHNPPNLSWLGTGTKYAGLHTRWLDCIPRGLQFIDVKNSGILLLQMSGKTLTGVIADDVKVN